MLIINPLDRIVRPKMGFSLVEHHAVYLGLTVANEQVYIENSDEFGVRTLSLRELFPDGLRNFKIKRYNGDRKQIPEKVNSALQYVGEPYNLLNNNCEHLANRIQKGKSESHQVIKWLFIVVLTILGIYTLIKLSKQK